LGAGKMIGFGWGRRHDRLPAAPAIRRGSGLKL
jgi:hypothetical protein